MSRPVIGLTTYLDHARFGVHDTLAAVLPVSYIRSVHAGGGRAVLIAPDDPGTDVLDGLDGLLLTGGADLDPSWYGEQAHPTTVTCAERDDAEMLLLRAALAADLPVLGICRGMQLLTVAYGGTLHQHLPEVLGHHGHRPVSGPKFGHHPVRLASGSRCAGILEEQVEVNSFHHQGVADSGRLTATGWAEDGLIEVVEDPAKPFVLGVQWHPEDGDDMRLFAALVAAAARSRVAIGG